MVLLKNPHHVPVEPGLQPRDSRPASHLAQVVLIARGLPIILVLGIEPLTAQGNIPRLRMDGLMSHLRTKGLDQPPGTHYIRKSMKRMDAMKAHGNVAGNVHP